MKFTRRLLTMVVLIALMAAACGEDEPDVMVDGPEEPADAAAEVLDDTETDADASEDDADEDTSASSDDTDSEDPDDAEDADVEDVDAEANDDTVDAAADTTTTTTAKPVEEAPVDTDTDVTQVASTPEFCEASGRYYASTEAGDFVPRRNSAAVRALFEEMDRQLIAAIDAAPNAELAEPALAAQASLTAVHDGIASFDYDGDAFEGSQTMVDLAPDFDVLAQIDGLLEQFLEGECGLSIRQLRVDGSILGETIVQRTQTHQPVDYAEVMDSAERIRVQLPMHWDDVLNQQTGETAVMIVAPNAALFDTSWATDGIRVQTSPTAAADLDFVAAIEQTAAAIECRLVSSDPYDDGTYVGQINRYRNCGETSIARVIGATSNDGEFTVLVEMQFDDHDTSSDATTLQTVMDTFLVR